MTYTAGDDITIQATLFLNGVKEDITGYAIKGALVLLDRSALAAGTSIVDGTIVNATSGLVSVAFPRATTATIVPGLYFLEIQAESGGMRTTYERVQIVIESGLIS